MAEEVNKQNIVEKIRKIMETAGRTEAEMMTAQALVQRLMMRYNIDKNDFFVSDGDIGITSVENTYEGHETKYWTWDLLNSIGRPYTVNVLRSIKVNQLTGEREEVYRLIGSKEDRDMVKSIFENILPVIRASRKLRWKEYQKRVASEEQTKPATFAKSYFKGYGIGLYDKLKADRDEFLKNMNEEDAAAAKQNQTEEEKLQIETRLRLGAAENGITDSNTMELIALQATLSSSAKWEMIVRRKIELVNEFIEKEFKHVHENTDRKSKSHSDDAFESGYVDGKQRYQGHQIGEADVTLNDDLFNGNEEQSSWLNKKTKTEYKLPIDYTKLNPRQRIEVRNQYIKRQANKCTYCGGNLNEIPNIDIDRFPIDLTLFPPNFLGHPIHLHHNHNTNMTEGAVHSYCNAVLWQYEGK